MLIDEIVFPRHPRMSGEFQIGILGLVDSGGAGAQHYAYTGGAIALYGRFNGIAQTVGFTVDGGQGDLSIAGVESD
jgi:hypothetical protein